MTTIRLLARTAFGIGVVVLIAGSLLPSEVLPETGLIDKWQHLLAYAMLMASFGVGAPAWRQLVIGAVALIALGVALEFLQALVPGRMPSALDVLANSIGIAIGLGLSVALNRALAVCLTNTAVTSDTSPR